MSLSFPIEAYYYLLYLCSIVAKLKAEAQARVSGEAGGTASIADVLRERKEKRDYKRRRQKYRAKNVHVTRRKTSEVCDG